MGPAAVNLHLSSSHIRYDYIDYYTHTYIYIVMNIIMSITWEV